MTPTRAYWASSRWLGSGRKSADTIPSEVESPMCTTLVHAVVVAAAGVGDGVGLGDAVAEGEPAGDGAVALVVAGAECDAVLARALIGAAIPEVRAPAVWAEVLNPTQAVMSSAVAVVTAIARQSRNNRQRRVGRVSACRRAHSRPIAPRRTGSSMKRHDNAATTTVASTWKIARTGWSSRIPPGLVSTMIGKCQR